MVDREVYRKALEARGLRSSRVKEATREAGLIGAHLPGDLKRRYLYWLDGKTRSRSLATPQQPDREEVPPSVTKAFARANPGE